MSANTGTGNAVKEAHARPGFLLVFGLSFSLSLGIRYGGKYEEWNVGGGGGLGERVLDGDSLVHRWSWWSNS